MTDDGKPANEGDGTGTQTNSTDTKPKADPTEYEKLKTSNDEFEKELVRGRELKAESQKLEAEKMLGGSTGGHADAPMVSHEDRKTKQASEFFKDTALGDAIDKKK